jgi:HEAT repeat protein/predicted MFS family arabinose efflux permease
MVVLLIGLMLFTSAGGSIGGNGIEALFFARFGVQFLPYMYMALGVITLITSLAITALLSRVARERLYIILPLALALLLIGERALLALNQNWAYPVLWLGMNVKGSLQGLLTWGLAGVACDTRQAKRLFPLFSAGGILGAVVGGLGTQSLANWLHSENLLLVWAGALFLAFFVSRALVSHSPAPKSVARRAARRRRTRLIDEIQQGYQFVRQSPLMRWMSAAVVLFAMLFFSLAFPFSKAATTQFPDADALAGFLGLFQGLSTGAAFLASLFLVNRLFARFGILPMILVFAVIYLIGFGVVAIYASFPALVVFRFVQTFWLSGIAGTAYQAVFNVVPPARRDQTRAFIDGVPGQAGTVIAGLILVIGEQALQPQQLYFIGLGAAVLMTVVMWQALRAYSGALVAALRAGQPLVFSAGSEEEPFGGFQRDGAAVAATVAGLSDPDPVIRRVSAEILGNLSAPEATPALINALADADAHVRAASLRALAHAQAAPALLEVSMCLADPEPEVRAQAVEALRHLAGGTRGLIAHLRPLLDDPAPLVRTCAAVALLRIGPDPQARDLLRNMAALGDTEMRVSALTALGDWGDAEAFELVAVELEDADAPPAVRRAAASALARVDAKRSLEWLIRALGDDDASVREAAATAIGQMGASALDPALAALSDPALEAGALLALEHLPAHQATPTLRDYARESVSRALRYHDLSLDIEAQLPVNDRLQLLTVSLRSKAHYHAANALRALALVGDRAALSLAIENLNSRDPGQRANALETLESVGDRHIVRPLMRLWEAVEATPAEPGGLLRVLQDSDGWLRACAALAAGGLADESIRTVLAKLARSDQDQVVRETAASALNGASTMNSLPTLSLMERILFLRRVPLFADLTPADLKQVGAIASERLYSDGDVIAHQGEIGDEMYVIVSGEVRVLAGGGPELARRRTGEYVGEMAIISREPRMASLVAAGEARLLCIDQKHFEGLLRERPETSLAVMRVLCERLRENLTSTLPLAPPATAPPQSPPHSHARLRR